MTKTAMSMPADKAMEYETALNRAAALCGSQEQCSSQIREKLRRWKVDDRDAEKVIQVLTREEFLDDARYAASYVREKFRFHAWGKIKLKMMLVQKDIPPALIEDALDQIDPELYKGTCTRIIQEKAATLKESNPFKRKGKLFRFAAQRGFESDLIHQILSYL